MRIVLICALSFFCFVFNAFANEKITISNVGSETSLIAFSILSSAYKKLDIQLEYVEYPGKRAAIMANSGKTDGDTMRIKGFDKDFPNLVMVPVPVIAIEWMAIATDPTIEINGWKSLAPYTIGIRLGIKKTEIATKGMKVDKVNQYESIVKKVSFGRNDIGVLPKITALIHLKKSGLANVKILEPPVDTTPLYHYLYKDNRHLVDGIAQALKEMKSSGETEKIMQKEIQKLLK